MTDEASGEGLYIDSDWKEEAAQEKERLAEQEQKEAGKADEQPGGDAAATFIELINTLAMQAAIALGGYQSPDGQRIPANPVAAKHVIDMLTVLETKTEGNLTDDEKRVLAGVLHELRMQYVQTVSGGAPAPDPEAGPQ